MINELYVDCMTVTSKDGHFYYKASPKDEVEPGTTCGLYLITDPERIIEIELIHVDVSCENGGLISVNESTNVYSLSL